MANNPKKIVDPTEAALSAIQEALKIRDDDGDLASQPETISDPSGELADHWRDAPPVLPPLLASDERYRRPQQRSAHLSCG